MRLAALSTTGELSPDERALLEEHLSRCEDCRHGALDYEMLVSTVLPSLAAELADGPEGADESESWSIEQAEKRLMQAVDQELPSSKNSPIRGLTPAQKKILGIAGIAIASGAVGYGGLHGYHAQAGVPKDMAQMLTPAAPKSPVAISSPPQQSNATRESSDQGTLLDGLRKELRVERARDNELQTEIVEANLELSLRDEKLTAATTERDRLAQQLSTEQIATKALQDQFATVREENTRGTTRLAALQSDMASLNAVVESKDRTIAEDQQLLQHDRDIRNLMGAPDLYIADIQDVAEDGKTRKPFGRVFYTRDKSLIFYGFDLDRQPGLKDASVFQAWGRRDTEGDVSLGVFYRDETNQRRWILKFKDADTLARLDSVFVTAEPRGGSTKPTGKPLLSTYLRLPANHP